jgi:hypothetical protein
MRVLRAPALHARMTAVYCVVKGTQAVDLRAVHAGGHPILDAVQNGFPLDDKARRSLAPSLPSTATCPPRR